MNEITKSIGPYFATLSEKFPIKTCSHYDVTLDLLKNDETVRLFGDLGMATLRKKLTVPPRIQKLSLEVIETKPRELSFNVTGNLTFDFIYHAHS